MHGDRLKNRLNKATVTGFILSALLLLAGAGFPFFKGIVLEQVVRQSVEDLNQEFAGSAKKIHVEILSWKKGWNRSVIGWQIQTPQLSALTGSDQLLLVDSLAHGYSSNLVSSTDLTQNQWYQTWVERDLGGKDPIAIQTVFTLAGDIRSQITMDAFSMTAGPDTVTIEKGAAHVEWSRDEKHLDTQFIWEGCKAGDRLNVGKIRLSAKSATTGRMIWEGTHDLSIDSMSIISARESLFLEKLLFRNTLSFNAANASFSVHTQIGADMLETGSEEIKDLKMRLELNHLDAGALERVFRAAKAASPDWKEALRHNRKGTTGLRRMARQQTKALKTALLDNWDRFLRKGCDIRIKDFTATVPEGRIAADVSLGLKKSMTLAGFLPVLLQPSQITDVFSLNSRIRLPYALVGYQSILLNPLVDIMPTGLFVTQGTDLVHEAQIRDNRLLLNQQEVLLE
jgi:uncharacterized protein YdgA (DUF945 family)